MGRGRAGALKEAVRAWNQREDSPRRNNPTARPPLFGVGPLKTEQQLLIDRLQRNRRERCGVRLDEFLSVSCGGFESKHDAC